MKSAEPIPHPYGCDCDVCRAMIAAIVAQNPDGSYFFSDRELEVLAERTADQPPTWGNRR